MLGFGANGNELRHLRWLPTDEWRGLMRQISVVSVPVSDQERAKQFYAETLGFTVLEDAAFGNGMRWIQLGVPDARSTTIALVTWFEAMPAGSLRGLVIDCEDINADYERLREKGVVFSGPPGPQPGGVFAAFSDPDGNQMALHQID
jgi:predicted enzyme related to lactoylglutathione lyase